MKSRIVGTCRECGGDVWYTSSASYGMLNCEGCKKSSHTGEAPEFVQAEKVIGIRALTKMFGPHAAIVLVKSGHLKSLVRKGKGPRRFEIVKELPSVTEYCSMRTHQFTTTVSALLGDAQGELEELSSEMSDWFDNLPESLQETDKGEAVEAAHDALENLNELEPPNGYEDYELVYLPPVDPPSSRSARRDEAVAKMQAVIEALVSGQDERGEDEDVIAVDTFVGEIEEVVNEAVDVEFPGMYS